MSVESKYAQTISVVHPATAPSDEYNIPVDRAIKTHVTISILGEIPEVGFSKEELVSALRQINWEEPEEAHVDRLALFGVDKNFLVMELESPALQKNWEQVNQTLKSLGIKNLDRFPDYRPHVTLKHDYEGELPTPAILPSRVEVGPPTLWWGTEPIILL